jgi:hypothetical protein
LELQVLPLIGGERESKGLRKPEKVAFNGFIDVFGFDPIHFGQVAIEKNLLTTHREDARGDLCDWCGMEKAWRH